MEDGAATRTVNFQKDKNSVRVTSARSQPVLNSKNMLHQSSLEDIHKEMFVLFFKYFLKLGYLLIKIRLQTKCRTKT